MELKNYFKKEKQTQTFYPLFPFMIAIEIAGFELWYNPPIEGLYLLLLLQFICTLCGVIFLAVHIITDVAFYNAFYRKLDERQRERVEQEARDSYRMGTLLITNDLIASYAMFSKRIILVDDIESVMKLDGKMDTDYFTVQSNGLRIKLKSGSKLEVKAPALYSGDECNAACTIIEKVMKKHTKEQKSVNSGIVIHSLKEAETFKEYDVAPPYTGIMILILIAVSMILPKIAEAIRHIIPFGNDYNKILLFHAGYDALYIIYGTQLVSAVFISMLIIRRLCIRNDKSGLFGKVVNRLVIIAIIFTFSIGFMHYSLDRVANVRTDYEAYKNKEYEVIEANVHETSGTSRDLMWIHDSDAQYALDNYNIKVHYLTNGKMDFILLNKDIRYSKSEKYRVLYLKNTHLITDIQVID